MAGFHGGHSGGGGGFHGGHSSGSFSSSSSRSRSSGNGYVVFYSGGRRRYAPNYGYVGDRPMTFAGMILTSIILLVMGFSIFALLLHTEVTATITNAQMTTDSYGDYYETYDFTYQYKGKTYQGYGEDDIGYNGVDYVFDIEVGEQYPLYINRLMPNNYTFENPNVGVVLFFIIFEGIGIWMLLSGLKKHKEYKAKLSKITDLNGDGKVDDLDLEIAESKHAGTVDGSYEGMKDAVKENTYHENVKKRYCPYCGSEASWDDRFCTSCGAALRDNNK